MGLPMPIAWAISICATTWLFIAWFKDDDIRPPKSNGED